MIESGLYGHQNVDFVSPEFQQSTMCFRPLDGLDTNGREQCFGSLTLHTLLRCVRKPDWSVIGLQCPSTCTSKPQLRLQPCTLDGVPKVVASKNHNSTIKVLGETQAYRHVHHRNRPKPNTLFFLAIITHTPFFFGFHNKFEWEVTPCLDVYCNILYCSRRPSQERMD